MDYTRTLARSTTRPRMFPTVYPQVLCYNKLCPIGAIAL